MQGFEEKLIVQSYANSMGNCVHYTYEMFGFAEKLNVETAEIQRGNCVHYICTECLDLLKKLNIQNSEKFNWKLYT